MNQATSSSHLLVNALREVSSTLLGNIIYEIFSLEGAAVNSLAMGHDKQFLAIRTDYITLNLFEGSLDCVHIEEDAHLLARLERITDNLLAIIADRSVQIGAINRVNTGT